MSVSFDGKAVLRNLPSKLLLWLSFESVSHASLGEWWVAISSLSSSYSSWRMWPPCHSIRKRLTDNHHLPVTCLLEGRIGISLLITFIKSCVVSLPGRSSTLIRHVICLCHIHYNLISVGESSNFSNGHTRETDMKAVGSSCWKRKYSLASNTHRILEAWKRSGAQTYS